MIAPLRNEPANVNAEIGCTVLTDVFYLHEENWIPIGDRFAKNIMVGRSYEAEADDGASILSELRTASGTRVMEARPAGEERYGRPFLQRARLGQGSFRTLIIDAYKRRCAITGEHTLPAFEAAHIQPFSEHGPHDVRNGLLLRSDFHKLFDAGLITIEPNLKVRVSGRIKDHYFNGKVYYRLHGQTLVTLPDNPSDHPDPSFLKWHNEHRFVE